MKAYRKRIKAYRELIQKEYVRDTAVRKSVESCDALLIREENCRVSYFELVFFMPDHHTVYIERAEAKQQTLLEAIENLMQSMKWTAEQAMSVLNIPVGEWPQHMAKL